MDKIIQHLPVRCLPTLRSTCKLWNKLMVEKYRERKSNDKPYWVKINNVSMDSVYDTLNEAAEVPFSAYKFKDIQMNTAKVQKVIDKVGGVMTHLELSLRKLWLPIGIFRTLLFKQCPVLRSVRLKDRAKSVVPRFWKSKLHTSGNEGLEIKTLPHLKNISLELEFEIENRVYPSSNFLLVSDLFRAAVNLETLKIQPAGSSGLVLNGVVLDIMCQQKKSGNLHKIKSIKFGERISIKNLEALVELSSGKSAANRLGLKKLNLRHFLSDDCFIDPQGVRLMNQFLSLQASSLQKLTASLPSWGNRYNVTLPVMTALKTLKMQMEYSSPPPPAHVNANDNNGEVNAAAAIHNGPMLPNIRFESLVINFPNLQKLKLMQMGWMMWTSLFDDVEEEISNNQAIRTSFMTQLGAHQGITEFSVVIDTLDSNYLVDYGSLFPNIKNLTVVFLNQLYHEVWRVWPALEVLNILLLFNSDEEEAEIDSSITGIPSQCLELLKSASFPSVNKTNDGQGKRNVKKESKELDWKQYKTQAGISDLHQLREFNFEINFPCMYKKVLVTDLSANYGFIPTANNSRLRKIYINKFSEFSPEVVAAVEASLGPHGDFVPINESWKKRQQREM